MRFRRLSLVGIILAAVTSAATFFVLTGSGDSVPAKSAEAAPRAASVPGSAPASSPAVLAHDAQSVVAFLDKNCIECHNKEDHYGSLILETYKDADSIRKGRKKWARVLTMVQGGAMPPADDPEMKKLGIKVPEVSKDDRVAFVSAAKNVLDYVDAAHPDPGRVTLRRLNRVEYSNSMKELLGITFDPAADFPPDDVGGGFDNNGDVLTISPLLMERYFAASESIMQQAFPEGGYWPTFQKIEVWTPAPGEEGMFEHTSLGREKFRHLLPGQRISFTELAEKPTVFDEKAAKQLKNIKAENKFPIEVDGDYHLRAMAYRHAGEGVGIPTMVLEVDGKAVGTFKVEANGYDESIFYDTPVHLTKGPHKISVTWPLKEGETVPDVTLDPRGKIEPPGLHVRWVEIVGPRALTPAEQMVLTHKKDAAPRDAAREVVERFASRAYRRPVTAAEVEKLLELYDAAIKDGLDWPKAIRQPIQAVLVSPAFLFREEADDHPELAGQHSITDYQLATRLSYFLWSSMPDDELMAIAAKNELHDNLESQVRRMLKDPRSQQLTENFASQWLHLRMLNKVTPDKERFPEYTVTLRNSMMTETLKFFGQIVQDDRSILDLLDGNFTYLNEPLAELYGIVDTKGNRKDQANPVPGGAPIKGLDFVRVELQGTERSGVLTQASVLTVTSNPGRTSPVKRGKFVLEQILGEPPPPPPPNVPSLDTGAKGALTGNVRQRMEKHRADPRCAACHIEMDAIGFAFENFDPIGKFRQVDGEYSIDASGTLPGGVSFNGASELKIILKGKSDVFAANFTREMMTFALGRQIQYYDKPAVDKIVKAVSADQYRFSRLVIEIVNSDPFRMRRGKDQIDE